MNSHSRLLKLGLDTHPVSATNLIKAYASHPSPNSLTYARQIFDRVPPCSRDPPLWTALLSAFARSHHPLDALRLFSRFLSDPHLDLNPFAFSAAARAAAAVGDHLLSQSLHCHLIKCGFHSHVVAATSILDAYTKSGDLFSARNLFDEMPHRNVVTWNSIISGYVTAGLSVFTIELFYQMKCIELEVGVDEFTVSSGLTACAGLSDLRLGAQIHGFVIRIGLETDHAVVNAMANMYFRCREVECAERVIEGGEGNVLVRLMMVNGYVFNERYVDAMRSIRRWGGDLAGIVVVNPSVAVSIVTVCANLGLISVGRQVHGIMVTLGHYQNCDLINNDDIVLGSALVDMYCKCSSIGEARSVFDNLSEKQVSHWNAMIAGCIHCGNLEEAQRLFDEMHSKNVISWTSMISGYMKYGLPKEGLRLLKKMYTEGGLVRGNCYTFASALNACSCLAALDAGKQIHCQALKTTADNGMNNLVLATALVDMYSKSGNLCYARRVFDRMGEKNVVSWSSMITGYATHGLGLEAIEVFEQMLTMGFEPNEVTFVSVLSACSHCGLVEQGMHYFNLMKEKYGIAPRGDHYACLVDMLARAGKLVTAMELVEGMKDCDMGGGESAAIWGALLGGCELHGNLEIGNKVAEEMIKRGKQVSDAYVSISNVYAAAEMWDKVYRVREEWKRGGVVKEPGHSQMQTGL